MLTSSCLKQVNTEIFKIEGFCKLGILSAFRVDLSFTDIFFPFVVGDSDYAKTGKIAVVDNEK